MGSYVENFLYGACAWNVIPSRNKNLVMKKKMKSGKGILPISYWCNWIYFFRDSVALQSVFNTVKNKTDGCLNSLTHGMSSGSRT